MDRDARVSTAVPVIVSKLDDDKRKATGVLVSKIVCAVIVCGVSVAVLATLRHSTLARSAEFIRSAKVVFDSYCCRNIDDIRNQIHTGF